MNVRPEQPNEWTAAIALADESPPLGNSKNVALRRFTILIVTLFWIGQFGANALYTQLNSPELTMPALAPRALVCASGAIITLLCIAVQDRWRAHPLRIRAYWAVAFTILSAAALSLLSDPIYAAFLGPMTSPFWIGFALGTTPRLWVFGSVYGMSLAISYASNLRERENEIAALKSLAQDAQLRALRSQLNPHFLFNALNSIAALIGEGRAKEAEQTTEHLADFLRITLSLDPQRLITVREEVALQRIYLEMQKTRFPTRLNFVVEIAPDVERALVPNLILQPLVENSIKHAVARSTAPVTLRMSARPVHNKLQIRVQDDGGNAASPSVARGSNIGLANVAERLSVHFGRDASLSFGPKDDGGFCNTILIPLRR